VIVIIKSFSFHYKSLAPRIVENVQRSVFWSSQTPIVSSERRTADLSQARRMLTQNSVVGVDGGGTKTDAVIIDSQQRVIGEGLDGPSQSLTLGIAHTALG